MESFLHGMFCDLEMVVVVRILLLRLSLYTGKINLKKKTLFDFVYIL